MDFLSTHNIVKQYSNHLALNKVSINIQENSIFGLLGPNGAGKTTLIRIINQITAYDEGEVLIKGRKLKPEDVNFIGYLPEERGLYKKMKVGEQALYLAQLKGLSRSDAMRKIKYWFEKFEITGWWDKKVEDLSKGMQQKVQFVTTVIHEPKLLIFDEPFSGFDPINSNLLKREILELKEKGATIIFSTHNMESVEELCDHISLIHNAEVILEGQIEEIKQKYKTNICEVKYNGDPESLKAALTKDFELVEEKINHHSHIAQIKLNGNTNNSLLKTILPKVEVESFSELIPSMNDVFIRVVEETNKNKTDK
ncbi:MAG: ATP-binding cassette domain-containing protein [Bacteroidales bacterium]|nr:ATP-binding cassette domain-containing protein [Bacteroidales bacterium]MCF8390766.1 ATP-binding cassette domain-containing protein [Bacteroidales bacterium]